MAAQAWEGFVLLNNLKGVTPAAVASLKDMNLSPLVPILPVGLPFAEPYFPTFPFLLPHSSFIPRIYFLKDQ